MTGSTTIVSALGAVSGSSYVFMQPDGECDTTRLGHVGGAEVANQGKHRFN